MLILVDPRRDLAVQPGDISSMQMISGSAILIPGLNDSGHVDLGAVHAQIMEASK
jgi:hypothetical protein